MKPVGTYDNLNSINKKLTKLSGCNDCYDSSSGSSVCTYLIQNSESCSVLDNAICGDADGSKYKALKASTSGSAASTQVMKRFEGIGNSIKYALGSVFLLASFIMFLGILMMNRRKRRANLNRKFRQSSSSKSLKSSSSRARSKSTGRSKSASRRSSSKYEEPAVEGAVYA